MGQPIHKAVILARGLGKRMREDENNLALDPAQAEAARLGLKGMIPIGRRFLDYVLSALADAGYTDVCLVVAPDHDLIRRYYQEEVRPTRIRLHYAIQELPRGTADAVAAAEAFAGNDYFLTINSDNYYPLEALMALREQRGSAVALFEQEAMIAQSNIAPERIRQFAVGLTNGDDHLLRILEKPEPELLESLPRPLWVSMNCWRFGPSIFEACRHIKPSPRGELEVTDAVQYAIDHLGERFHVVRVRAGVLDLTRRSDIPSVARFLQHVPVRL
jgi:glucose-1-phosphate thymidylyltransferase